MIEPMRMRFPLVVASAVLAIGCESKTKYTTTLEVTQAEPFEDGTLGLELRYADCPGYARRVLRADKAFAACARGTKAGDKLTADIVSIWRRDRDAYRTEIVRLGDCPLKQDPKDPANYEMVETCSDVVATGVVIGVRCDRTRNDDLVAKCPWLRRR